METNTLVTHKKFKSLGIGCISKVLKSSYKVNFGKDDVSTCKENVLEVVDTSQCKTISFKELRAMTFTNSPNIPKYVIIGNELRHYIGIGWVCERVVTHADLSRYPRVVD